MNMRGNGTENGKAAPHIYHTSYLVDGGVMVMVGSADVGQFGGGWEVYLETEDRHVMQVREKAETR